MDELKSYADRRLELGDMMRAALYLAREAGDERAEQRARDRVAAFQAELGSAAEDDASAGIVTAVPSPEAAAEDCAVRRQMEQTLTSHLYSGQFRLATREDEQGRHTLGGGFCPLHTWQYAAIASPLGISAGYAGLAASVADALDGLGGPGFAAAPARGAARSDPVLGRSGPNPAIVSGGHDPGRPGGPPCAV